MRRWFAQRAPGRCAKKERDAAASVAARHCAHHVIYSTTGHREHDTILPHCVVQVDALVVAADCERGPIRAVLRILQVLRRILGGEDRSESVLLLLSEKGVSLISAS